MSKKTEDYFFRGFPAVWNIVLFYLFVVETSQWINFTVIIFFSVMTFIPFEYIHPFRVKEKKYLNLFITFIWGLCCLLLLIDLRDTLSPFSAYREIYFWLWVVLNLYFLTFTIKRSITVK